MSPSEVEDFLRLRPMPRLRLTLAGAINLHLPVGGNQQLIFRSLIIALALSTSGCIPREYTKRPAAAGVVIDTRTGLPLSGTSVSLLAPVDSRGAPLAKASTSTVVTGADGRFVISRKTGWFLATIIPALDLAAIQAQLTATHEGYAPASRVLFERDLEKVRIELPPRP